MSKPETIDALLASALHEFSRRGFEGASLRDIAGGAGVALGTVSLYFPSKAELYGAVGLKVLEELSAHRLQLLEAAAREARGQPLPLEAVVRILARPVVELALAGDPESQQRLALLRRGLSERTRPEVVEAVKGLDRFVDRLLDAMAVSCPALSRTDLVWAFSYVVSVVYSWQLVDRRYDRLLQGDRPRTVEEVVEDLAAFAAAGVRAMAARRSG